MEYVQSDTGVVVHIYDEWRVVRCAKVFFKRGGKWNRSWLKFVVGKITNKLVTLCLGKATRQEIYEWRLMMNGVYALANSIMAEAISSAIAPQSCYALIKFGFALLKKTGENFAHVLEQVTLLLEA